jgi:hypothetical protein
MERVGADLGHALNLRIPNTLREIWFQNGADIIVAFEPPKLAVEMRWKQMD